jgi:hypothetical protein
MRNDPESGTAEAARERRTLKVCEWPDADRIAWEAACKPSHRLKKEAQQVTSSREVRTITPDVTVYFWVFSKSKERWTAML